MCLQRALFGGHQQQQQQQQQQQDAAASESTPDSSPSERNRDDVKYRGLTGAAEENGAFAAEEKKQADV